MNELDCNPIIVKTKLEQEDFINVRYALTKFKSSRFIKPLAIYLILFVVILFILTLYTSNPPSSVQDSSTPMHYSSASLHPLISYLPTIFFICFIAFIVFGRKWLIKYSSKKHFDSNKLIQKEMTYTFTNETVECVSESTSAKIRWNEVFKIAETKKSIVIYISNLTAWIIPKRSFTELDLDRFKESVYPKFPKKKVEFIKK